jgi:hypothetical protein
MSTDEMILDMLGRLDRRMEQLDQKIDLKHNELVAKVDQKFNGLKCADQNLRIDRLEQKEIERKEGKALTVTALLAGVSAFGLTAWQWMTK